jgi:hypothetical protein
VASVWMNMDLTSGTDGSRPPFLFPI